MKKNTKNLVFAAMFAAVIFAVTRVVQIPIPNGYINLGDCFVLLAGWLLGPLYGFLASAIGAALADALSPFAVYAPATFVIKGLVALAAYLLIKAFGKIKNKTVAYVISGVIAELIMVGGYYVFEGFMYGWKASLVNIPLNSIQAVAGIVCATILVAVINKTGVLKKLK